MGRNRFRRDKTQFSLLFVDDQVVIAADMEDVAYTIRKLSEEYSK